MALSKEVAANLARSLTNRYRLLLEGASRNTSAGVTLEFLPTGVDAQESFSLCVTAGWRSVRAEFVPGKYARDLLREMGGTASEKKRLFCAVAKEILSGTGTLTFRINSQTADPADYSTWPVEWNQVSLVLQSSPIETDADLSLSDEASEHSLIWAGRLLGLVMALLPLEDEVVYEAPEAEESQTEHAGAAEGRLKRMEVNRYERSRANRAACIAIQGVTCRVCGFDFGQVYGRIGDGYVEVHHITPVSKAGDEGWVDPATDLVPLCANCHAMVHRTDPPIAIQDLCVSPRNSRDSGSPSLSRD